MEILRTKQPPSGERTDLEYDGGPQTMKNLVFAAQLMVLPCAPFSRTSHWKRAIQWRHRLQKPVPVSPRPVLGLILDEIHTKS